MKARWGWKHHRAFGQPKQCECSNMVEITISGLKQCSKCGEIKLATEYQKHKGIKSGLRPNCKSCSNAQNKQWKLQNPKKYADAIATWWRNNPEKQKAKDARRKEKDPDWARRYCAKNRDRINKRNKEHYVNNKERRVETHKAWLLANKERSKATQRQWRRANPEKSCAYNHFRRAVRNAIKKHHTSGEIAALLISQSYLCANPLCAADLRHRKKHLDHKIPFVKGGSNEVNNLQWMCAFCNLSKGRRTMEEWMGIQMAKEAKRQ